MNIGDLAIKVIVFAAIVGIVLAFFYYTGLWAKVPWPFKIVAYALMCIVAILVLLSFAGMGPVLVR